ncbi:MAG: BspA family leucine-rich repeat surface protein, partial [Maribacter sp.]
MLRLSQLVAVMILLLLGCTKDADDETISYTMNVAITPSDGGTAAPSSGTFDEGTVVNIEATPSNGYFFVEWTGSVQSTANPVAITMDSDMAITGVFTKSDADEDGVTDDLDSCPDTPSGESVDENGCPTPSPIYLDENGITIKCYDWGQVGVTAQVNGITYTIVNEDLLRQMVIAGEDVTTVCTTKVTDMSGLFFTTQFNQDIGSWDVGNVTDMSGMFSNFSLSTSYDRVPFNQDISYWDVSKVTNMREMFSGSLFNRDIGSWDVGNVTDMSRMFGGLAFYPNLSPFNQDIGSWNVGN